MKKLLFTLLLCLLAVPLWAQRNEAEREAMYYIRKAYDYSRAYDYQGISKAEEAFKYIRLFETYLDRTLDPKNVGDSIAIYYAQTLMNLQISKMTRYGTEEMASINLKTLYAFADRLSKQNKPIGYTILGLYYITKEEESKALHNVFMGANLGDAVAQYMLSNIYMSGGGELISKDISKTLMWLIRSAEQGYAPAQYDLGSWYKAGSKEEDIPQNYKEAIKWFRKAANQGYVEGEFQMGVMYDEGLGVSRDLKEALKWFAKVKKKNPLKGTTAYNMILREMQQQK